MTIGRQSGFVLSDLLVSLAILGVLSALLFPAIQHARESTRRLACQNNLRQMGIALQAFQAAHGRFPPSASASQFHNVENCDPQEVAIEDNPGKCTDYDSWTAACLPFMSSVTLSDDYLHGHPWSSIANRAVVGTRLSIFRCPSAPEGDRSDRHHVLGAAATDYGAIAEVDRGVYTILFGVPDPGSTGRLGLLAEYQTTSPVEVTDGLSNTMMVDECAGRPVPYVLGKPMSTSQFAKYSDDEVVVIDAKLWVEEGVGWADPDAAFSVDGSGTDGVEVYGPRMINATNAGETYSFHRGGAPFLYGDGSVRFLDESIDPWIYIALCTRAGGEVVGR